MRYWVYTNNEVQGPFEIRELSARPGFSGSSLVCPETAGGGQAAEWKEASNYPEIFAAPAAAPAPAPAAPKPAPAEDMLALTMRGSLVSEPVFDDRARPSAPPAQGGSKVGDLVFTPPPSSPAAAPAADQRLDPLKKKLDQMSATLKSMGESQVQLNGRIAMLESAIADMKALLENGGPKAG
jgi:hypothetical protein